MPHSVCALMPYSVRVFAEGIRPPPTRRAPRIAGALVRATCTTMLLVGCGSASSGAGVDAGAVTDASSSHVGVDASAHPAADAGSPDGAGTTTDGGAQKSLDGGVNADAAVDAADAAPAFAWSGVPAATPLVVRDPYLSTWSAADAPGNAWPTFWTGAVKAIVGIARVDGKPFTFLGTPGGVTPTPAPMPLTARAMTATDSAFTFTAGGVALRVDFLSPVEPGDLRRQSAPIGYVTSTAQSTDAATHAVTVYFDISGEWANADDTQTITWKKESVPHGGGALTAQSFSLVTPKSLAENGDYPSWGTPFVAADSAAATTAIGRDSVVRSMAAANGTLDGSVDTAMPRAINDNWPVLGTAFDLGSVSPGKPSSPAVLVLGHARSPDVSYQGMSVPPLWMSYWSTWEEMAADAIDDAAAAATRNAALDARISADATAAGGDEYAALCAMSLRQAFGGTELVGTEANPWMMLKEISSDGNVSTVDVVYPASPAFLYTNPVFLRYLLEPLLTYAESGLWTPAFAEHDLGASYPNANGHNDGGGENMPVEETANMLIMMAAYTQRASPTDAKAYATAHYAVATKWAKYLLANALDPGNQNQTDDFTGFIAHSVNLALKGIVGVGAMSILSGAAGNTADQASYLSQAKTLVASWAQKAQSPAGKHLLLVYDEGQSVGFDIPSSWSLKYNALYDRVLGLNLVPTAVLQEEASWYSAQLQTYGIVLDPRNSYTKTDWSLWAAGAIDDATVRQSLIDGVYKFATNTATARVPFSDWYCVVDGPNSSDNSTCAAGQQKGFQARPVQGGIFSLLARQGTSIVSP